MSHRCPRNGCPVTDVPDAKLLCPNDWYRVPKPLRRAVWIAWHRGAGAGSPAHRAAMRAAIAAVNRAA
jgi:hypothetical protein